MPVLYCTILEYKTAQYVWQSSVFARPVNVQRKGENLWSAI